MVTIVFLVIGFFVTGGAFGAQLIGAFDLAQYWLWFVAVLATILAIIIFFGMLVGGGALAHDAKLGKLGTSLGVAGGGILGALLSIAVTVFAYAQLWLSYYIIDIVPATAESFSDIPQNGQYAVYAFAVIMVVGILRSSRGSKD